MLSIKSIISLVLAVVVAVVLVPTIWDAVWVDTLGCYAWNTTKCPTLLGPGNAGIKDCHGTTCSNSTGNFCLRCLNTSSTRTLLTLTPMLFVALLIIVGILLATGVPIPGT